MVGSGVRHSNVQDVIQRRRVHLAYDARVGLQVVFGVVHHVLDDLQRRQKAV